MKIIPLSDRILVESAVAEEKTASGLFIPQASQEKTQVATVVAIGDDETIKVKVGDRILHEMYTGTTIKDAGKEFLLLNMADVLAIIE